jgi:hypothetical protein
MRTYGHRTVLSTSKIDSTRCTRCEPLGINPKSQVNRKQSALDSNWLYNNVEGMVEVTNTRNHLEAGREHFAVDIHKPHFQLSKIFFP